MADFVQTISRNGSIFPGNSLGTTTLPLFPDSTMERKVGEGASQVGWAGWLTDVSNAAFKVLNPLGAVMPTAAEIARTASVETSTFVKKSVDKAVGSATGLGETVTGFFSNFRDTVKYLAWGLIAVAVIYVLAVVVAPVTATLGRK